MESILRNQMWETRDLFSWRKFPLCLSVQAIPLVEDVSDFELSRDTWWLAMQVLLIVHRLVVLAKLLPLL